MEWLLSTPACLDVPVRALVSVSVSVFTVGGLLFAAAVTRVLLHWRRWSRNYRQACELLCMGGLERAEDHFRSATRGAYGAFRTAALAGVGVCRMQRGAYAEAAAMFEPLMEQRLPRSMRLDEIALPGHLALCLAMLGDTSRARHWLGEAHERFGGRVTFLLLPEIAILCREGHVGAALKMMEDCWPLLMADGRVCVRLRLFRAFAQWKVDPERNTDFVFMTLLSLAPIPEGEMAFCQEHWPVLADFMRMGNDLVVRREQERAQREAELQARYDERDRQLAERVVAALGTPGPDDDDDTTH